MSLMRTLWLVAFSLVFLLFSCSGGDKESAAVADKPAAEEEAAAAEEVAPPKEAASVEVPAAVEKVVTFTMSDALKSTLATMRPEQRAAENPFAGQEGAIREGGEEFSSLCAHCHGKGGKGDGPASKALGINPGDLTTSTTTPGERFEVMKNGVAGTPMQAFGMAMSEKQIWSLIAYMDSLRPALEAPSEEAAGEATP